MLAATANVWEIGDALGASNAVKTFSNTDPRKIPKEIG
jgi:hypothetical protein